MCARARDDDDDNDDDDDDDSNKEVELSWPGPWDTVLETTMARPGILSDFKNKAQTQKDTSALLTFNKGRCSDRERFFHAGASPQVVDRGPPRPDWYKKIAIN